MCTIPSLSLHFSRMASWMARCQFSPTSLGQQDRSADQNEWGTALLWTGLISVYPTRANSLVAGLGSFVRTSCETVAGDTHMTGSNMLRIFRHGVKLLGGEFLLSSGNAEIGHQKGKELNELDPTSFHIQSHHRNLWWIFLTTAGSQSELSTLAALHHIVVFICMVLPLWLGIICQYSRGFLPKPRNGNEKTILPL